MLRSELKAGDVGVVICAHSTARFGELLAAVDSVQTQRPAAAEVVVVIDHNPELLALARDEITDATVLPSAGQPGLCGARNTGLRRLTAEVVAFLDDDACAGPGWIEEIAGAFDAPDVWGIGGWVSPRWEAENPSWLPHELFWLIGCSYNGLPADRAQIRNGIGANMAFRRRALIELGGFAEDIGQSEGRPMRDDETELSIRLRARWPEARIVHHPAAQATHYVPSERATWSYMVRRSWGEGRGKAVLTRHHGSHASLESERRYVARVLPSAVVRGLGDGLHGDLAGFGRALSIAVSLIVTATGYVVGRVS